MSTLEVGPREAAESSGKSIEETLYFMLRRIKISLVMLAILILTSLTVTKACGGSDSDTTKREIVFAGLNWDSALIQNGVARFIVDNGYGYPTSHVEGATVPLFEGLRKGDIDITMEIWLPNQQAVWDNAIKAGEVIPVGKSLEDNWQNTFLIPDYVAEAHPGLKNVEDLKKDEYKALFVEPDSGGKAVLIGCIAQWACRGINEGQLKAYGLEEHVELRDPGTMAGLNGAIQGAYTKKAPVLFYYWGPTTLSSQLNMVGLEQPPIANCAGADPALGCEIPAAEVLVAMNMDLVEDAPELITFFRNWDWSASNQLAAEGWHADNKDAAASSDDAYTATAIWYLKNNDAWKAWLPEAELAKVEEALAAK